MKMNKYAFIAIAALAGMAVSSCDEYTLPNPPAQSNPDIDKVFDSNTLSVTSLINGTIDLNTYRETGEPIKLYSVKVEGFPSEYTLELDCEFCATDAFDKIETVKCALNAEGVASIALSEMQNSFNALVSKDVVAKDLYVRVPAYAVNGTTKVRIGGPDVYYFTGMYNILPIPQANAIETGYYLVGSFCDWDIAKGLPFTHTEEGNPYDHPVFMIKIDVTAEQANAPGGYQWKIVPKSGFEGTTWQGAFGVQPGTNPNAGGLVVAPAAETEAGVISQEGPYMITVNFEKRHYEVSPAFEYLWVPGFGSSTSNFDKIMRLTTTNYINYEGTLRLANRFWFTGQASLDGVNFRPDGEDYVENKETGVLSGKMKYDVESTGTMKVPGAGGLYYLTANMVDLTWQAVPIPEIDLIGGFNGWDTATSVALTPNSTKTVWTVTQTFTEPGEYKFCVNKAWAYSFGKGDTDDSIRQDGGNYNMTEAGTYEFALHFDVFPNRIDIVKK